MIKRAVLLSAALGLGNLLYAWLFHKSFMHAAETTYFQAWALWAFVFFYHRNWRQR